MKAKNTEPHIDYDKANFLTRLYDFINHANQMRKDVYTELDFMSRTLAIMQSKISEMKAAFTPVEDPENHIAYLNYDHFTNDISSLRHDSWEAGLTTTLFEKLKDRAFRKRFTGWAGGRLYSKRKSRISTEMTHNAPFRGHKAPDGIKQYARRQP